MNQQIENIFTVRVLHLEDSLIRFEVKNEMGKNEDTRFCPFQRIEIL